MKENAKITAPSSNDFKRQNGIVTDKVGNYEKHPFFVKKLNKANEKIEKFGLPKINAGKTI
jgi:hypothetical protein